MDGLRVNWNGREWIQHRRDRTIEYQMPADEKGEIPNIASGGG